MDDRIGPIGGLLAILLVIAGMALVFGGPQAAGRVLVSPFHFFGWVLRGVLGFIGQMVGAIIRAIGRGIATLIAETHRYFHTRWPGWTIAVEVGGVFLVALALFFTIWLRT